MSEGDFTLLLDASRSGDRRAWSALMNLIYADLHRLASRQSRRSNASPTLGTTGLVHECYLRLSRGQAASVVNRKHFFNLASRVMRQVLCDYARERLTQKRGAGIIHEQLSGLEQEELLQAEDLAAIGEALARMETLEPEWARVFECRFFAGFSEEETSETLDMPLRTVQRHWQSAKTWLAEQLG